MIYIPSRVKRHKHKFAMQTGLNLISLMDIFTTLVFFLLIHVSGEGEEILIPENVRLPLSISRAKPQPAPIIYVTPDNILLNDIKVAEVRDVLNVKKETIERLEIALTGLSDQTKDRPILKGKVIIMGDETIPFTLLKTVMNTCSKAGYPAITLAVIQKEGL